jgi:hypothetical protein
VNSSISGTGTLGNKLNHTKASGKPTPLFRNRANTIPTLGGKTTRHWSSGTHVHVDVDLQFLISIGELDILGGQAEDIWSRTGERATIRAVADVAVGLCEEVFLA